MEKNYLLFSLLLLIATSYAQVSPFYIKGKIDSSLPYLVLYRESNNGIVSIRDTIKIAADKTFSKTIKINKPTKAFLTSGDKSYQLWLTSGNSLTIHLKNENVLFFGNAGIFASYYMEDNDFWSKTLKYYQKRNPNFDKGKAVNSDKYFSIQDSITNQRLDFLKKYFIHSSIKEKQAFIKQESMSLIYSNLNSKSHIIEKFKFYQDKQKINSSSFYGFSDEVKFNNKEALSNDYFRRFTISFVLNLITQRRNQSNQKFVFDSFLDSSMSIIDELIEENNLAEEVKICFIDYIVEEMKRNKNNEWAEKIYVTLLSVKSQNTPFVKEKLDKLCMNTRFNRGNSAPDFSLTDLSGKNYSLKDFKGKKIYIDLGASWCSHCVENIPSWNKLVEENEKNNDVIFISISLDDTEEKWRTYTEKYHIKGLKLYAGKGGFESSFAISYEIKSLPQYMLIDKEGKFDEFNAPSLDREEIKKELQR